MSIRLVVTITPHTPQERSVSVERRRVEFGVGALVASLRASNNPFAPLLLEQYA